MPKNADTKAKPLIERLRQSKSTAKTRFIARWPEIEEALKAGFTAKAIHAELEPEGLQISYRRFIELVNELNKADQAPTTPPPSMPSTHDILQKKDVIKTGSSTGKKYTHDPHPKEDDLI